MSLTPNEIWLELKSDRAIARKHILSRVTKTTTDAIRAGTLPSIGTMIDNIMDEVSQMMAKFPDIPKDAWKYILQTKAPDKSCEEVKLFIEQRQRECMKKEQQATEKGNGAVAAANQNP